jgi:predicted Zn-dependent protease
VLGALLVVASRRERAAAPIASEGSSTHPPVAGTRVEPSRENVAPAFAREVAALAQRLAASPSDSMALLRLGRLYQDAHRPAAAAGYYRRYLQRVPADRQAWLDLAAVTAATGDWDGALGATAARFFL